MRSKLFHLALIGLSLAACNGNKPAANFPTTTIDTVNHTGSVDSTQQTTNSGAPAMKGDSAFLCKANDIGMFEIKIGQLAMTNSQSTDVKEMADMMIQDHSDFGKKVMAQASKENITLPAALCNDNQKEYDKLSGLNGKLFDKEYANVNVKGHKDAIEFFEKTAKDQDCSTNVQQLASSALPTLHKHKEHADKLKTIVKM